MKFTIEGVDRKTGKQIKGNISADSEELALKQAAERGIMISSIKPHKEAAPTQNVSTQPSAEQIERLRSGNNIHISEKYPFLRTVYHLYGAAAVINLFLCAALAVMLAINGADNVLAVVIILLVVIAYAAVSSVGLCATGEVIKVFIDIEENTRAVRETGFNMQRDS
jgi:hypothetical protein